MTRPPGRKSALSWALALLAVAVALDIAVSALRAVEPELITIGIMAAVIYVIYVVHRFWASRW
jgi:Na+-translocating ferredoxin:NAD+ oxidoreductase RnfE subunit